MKVTDLSAKAHRVLSKPFCALMFAMAVASFASCEKENEPVIEPVKVTAVKLNETALDLLVGEVIQLTATVYPYDADDKSVTWSSSKPSVATVDNNGNVTAKAVGEAIITVTTNNGGKTETCEFSVYQISSDINGVVINGIRWATRNVDAPGTFAASPEQRGMYYQWDSNIGWSSEDPLVNSNGGTKWFVCSYPREGDTWDKINDPSPSGWRVPTYDELNTLLDENKVNRKWVDYYGISGWMFTDKDTWKSIFLSYAGYRERWAVDIAGWLVHSGGNYWSSTMFWNRYADGHSEYGMWRLLFINSTAYMSYTVNDYSFSIRPVAE
jgi:hypothetical protein